MRDFSFSSLLSSAAWAIAPKTYAAHLRAQGERDFEAYEARFPANCVGDCQKRAAHLEALGNKPTLDANDIAILKGAFVYAYGSPRSSDPEVLALYRTVGRHPQIVDDEMMASLAHAATGSAFPRFREHQRAATEALGRITMARGINSAPTAIADVYIAPA